MCFCDLPHELGISEKNRQILSGLVSSLDYLLPPAPRDPQRDQNYIPAEEPLQSEGYSKRGSSLGCGGWLGELDLTVVGEPLQEEDPGQRPQDQQPDHGIRGARRKIGDKQRYRSAHDRPDVHG